MYYTGWSGSQHYRIGLAISLDGKTWARNSSPILTLGPSGSWDSQEQAWCDVRFEGGTYTMWYSGSDGSTISIGVATSTNGIDWTKLPTNPVLARSSSGWDSHNVHFPMVTKADNMYYMVYRGNSTVAENCKLGVASSPNGTTWTRVTTNPIFVPTETGWEGVSLDGGTLLFRNNKFHLWYCALSSVTAHWQIGYATAGLGPLEVKPEQLTPHQLSLSQGYPNPFNPETRLEYSVPSKTHVSIMIFDLLGKRIETLVDEEKEAGTYSVHWKPTNAASGIFWCRLQANGFVESRKIVLLK
jgi:hypothetical protein